MSYSEDDYDYEDKDDFVAEFAARERVGSARPTFIDVHIDVQKGKKGRLSLKNELSPDQLFLFDLQKNYYKYQDDIDIGIDDIETIKSIVLKIPHISFKNPIAFLFAYYVLNKNKKDIAINNIINEERFNRVKSIIKGIEGIEPEDIIRYARFIHKFL
jgi:hypothetical protein